jgi:gamma-glutamylcyclotransferase (GGCT)/AIG2-like uncharacterized protein YtfP
MGCRFLSGPFPHDFKVEKPPRPAQILIASISLYERFLSGTKMGCNLFAYGTLMVEEIMTLVTGDRFESTPARLMGYGRYLLRGEHYPGIRPMPRHRVDGLLYLDLGENALGRLDLFEGEMYRRRSVTLCLPDAADVCAETYVLRPPYYNRLSNRPWDLQTFLRTGRRSFINGYAGVSRLQADGDARP